MSLFCGVLTLTQPGSSVDHVFIISENVWPCAFRCKLHMSMEDGKVRVMESKGFSVKRKRKISVKVQLLIGIHASMMDESTCTQVILKTRFSRHFPSFVLKKIVLISAVLKKHCQEHANPTGGEII